MSQETRCTNCHRVLTTSDGERLHPACFDSSLPTPFKVTRNEPVTVWARCEECMALALKLSAAPP